MNDVSVVTDDDTCNYDNKTDSVRFVLISDTHTYTEDVVLPQGDILIHAGDFTFTGRVNEVKSFDEFLSRIKHLYKHIVVVCGNHELSFDKNIVKSQENVDRAKDLLTNCIYLQDETVCLFGFNIYGTPWTPLFRGDAFNIPNCDVIEKLNLIPDDTDILVTHGPPFGYGDLTRGGNNVGCKHLLDTVKDRIKPKLHVFGHIHEGYGIFKDEQTTFVNAAICTRRYIPSNKPIIIDIKKPTVVKQTSQPLNN